MHEYIKRSDAITEVNRGDLLVGNNAERAREIICRTPYADVVEVKRGRWILKETCGSHTEKFHCSVCDKIPKSLCTENYCPNCGAKMDGTQ